MKKHEHEGKDDFWSARHYLFTAKFPTYYTKPQKVWGRFHTSEEQYFGTASEIIPLEHKKGKETYIMIHPYVLEPKLTLTIGLYNKPKQYAWFSELLLSNLKDQLGSQSLENHLRRLSDNLADAMRHRLLAKTPVDQVAEIAALMQELGYEAPVTSQADDELPSITACNCVYHQLARKYREVCSLDLALLSSLSGRKIEHVECMARGGWACRFKMTERLKRSQSSDYDKLASPS